MLSRQIAFVNLTLLEELSPVMSLMRSPLKKLSMSLLRVTLTREKKALAKDRKTVTKHSLVMRRVTKSLAR